MSYVTRVVTFRLEPDREQMALLKLRDEQATAYMNRYSVHLYAERNGWRAQAEKDKPTSTVHASPGELSSAIYVACQQRVRSDWSRIGGRIKHGGVIPTYRRGTIPFDSGGRPDRGGNCGVKIIRARDGGFSAMLHVSAQKSDALGWIEVPLGRSTVRDQFRAITAAELADGERPILKGEVRILRGSGKVLLSVATRYERTLAPLGQRTATLSEFEDGRLFIRTECGSLDYSSRLHALREKKLHWDAIRRRFTRRMMRRKGCSRTIRRKLDHFGLDRWLDTEMHRWSADIVRWAHSQGCARIVIAPLIGSDWPAHMLAVRIRYKAADYGLSVDEPALDQEPTARAVEAEVRKTRSRAKKLADAVGTINDVLNRRNNGRIANGRNVRR